MPLGTNNTTTTTAANYIPQLWSDEVIAAFKANLVFANLITRFNMTGKRGSVINVPNFTRSAASAKAQGSQVTLIAPTHGTTPITINKWFEYSILIEDIVEKQALDSLRQAHTDDAGYGLAKQVDTDLVQLGRSANGGAGTAAYANAFIGGDGTTAYTSGAPNQTALTDAAIRRTIQRFDDADYPMMNRFFIVPPSSRNTLMGISRFTEQAFTGEGGGSNTIRTGKLGDIYGIPVYVTSNADTATGAARIAIMGHKAWSALAMQEEVRTQSQYKQEYLSDLFTADCLYGVAELRDNGAIPLAVPA
jgi:N4-gp56 family major capsid protein